MDDWEQQFTDALEIGYSYQLAKRMEQFKTNPALGYRTAGSKAEFETGEMLCREMEAIGLKDVHKDKVTVDAWEFEKAEMRFTDSEVRHSHRSILSASAEEQKKYSIISPATIWDRKE